MRKQKLAGHRILAIFLCLILTFGTFTMDGHVFAMEPNIPEESHWEDIETEVQYLNSDRTEAEITLTKKAVPHDPVNIIFLVDASANNRMAQLNVQQVLSLWGFGFLFSYGTAHPTNIISYGESAESTGFITDRETALGTVIAPMEGDADEVAALQAAKSAVDQAHNTYNQNQTVVIWIPGTELNMTDDKLESELQRLSDALKADDALITFQDRSTPSEILKKYATQYIPAGETDMTPAAYAYSSTGSSGNLFSRYLRDTIEQAVHDHYFNITTPFRLAEGQSLITKIEDVSYESDSRLANLTIDKTADGSGFDLTINKMCRQAGFSLVIKVQLDPNKQEKQTVFEEMRVTDADIQPGGGLYTGIFDEKAAEQIYIRMPAVTLNRASSTISYVLGDQVQGQTPAAATAMAGRPVAIAPETGITKIGSTFGGWVSKTADGRTIRYKPGEIIAMPETDMTLTPAWGGVGVTLEVESAEQAASGNTLMQNAGIQGALDFSKALVDGVAVGDRVRTISFQDKELEFSTAPSLDDPLKISLDSVPEASYARQVGEDGMSQANNVVAYLVKRPDDNSFDMIVCGSGGVKAPENSDVLFSSMNAEGKPQRGWQSGLERIDLTYLDTSETKSLMAAFFSCNNLTEIIGIEDINLENAESLFGIFRACEALTEMNLSAWRTPALKNASYLFSNCTALKSVDLTWPKTNMRNVATIRNLFYMDKNLEVIKGVEEWELPNVTELTSAFMGCGGLTSIDLSAWKPEKVTDISHLFRSCKKLNEVTVEGWNLPNLQMMEYTFADTILEDIDLSTWTNLDALNDFYVTFGYNSALKTVKTPGFCQLGFSKMKFYVMFDQSPNLKEWDISDWVFDSNKHSMYDLIGQMAFWGNESGAPHGVKITADNMVITGDAKVRDIMFPWRNSTKVSPSLISANGWNLNDTEQDLSDLLSIWRANTITDFSGWTGFAGVTSMSRMFKDAAALKSVDIWDAELPALTSAENMFQGAANLQAINLTGWNGITDEQVLTDIFNGVNADAQLTASDDQIGGWLKAKFPQPAPSNESATQGDTRDGFVSEMAHEQKPADSQAHRSLPEEYLPLSAVEEDMTITIPRAGAAAVPDAANDESAAQNALANGAAPSAANRDGGAGAAGSAVTIYPEATKVGTEVTLRATARYEGDLGAKSGRIELNVPLPANMQMAPEPDIQVSGFKYTDTSAETGFFGGTVVVSPQIREVNGVTALHAVFGSMYSGTEVEVSFEVKLKTTPLVGSYRLWDVTAYTQDANTTAVSDTQRFWWSQDSIPPTNDEYRVAYEFSGEYPSDAALPGVQLFKLNEEVTLPEAPTTSKAYFSWNGWSSDDVTITETPDGGGKFAMPNRNVSVRGVWELNEGLAPKVAVAYVYEAGGDPDQSVPDGAPELPGTQNIIVGRDHEIISITQDVDYHTFHGWRPALTIGGAPIPGTESNGVYTFRHDADAYVIDMSESGGTLLTEQFRSAAENAVNLVSVNFVGSWRPYTGTVSFDANGGIGSMEAMHGVTHKASGNLPLNAFAREGYEFDGWSLHPDGTAALADGAPLKGLITQDGMAVTLYAQWRKTVHDVTYELTNVTAEPQPTGAAHGDPLSIALKPAAGMKLKTVSVEMNGVVVTDTAYDPSSSKVEIAAVNGDIHIAADAVKKPGGGGGGGGGGSEQTYPVTLKINGNGTAAADKSQAAFGNFVTITAEGTVKSISAVSDKDENQIALTDEGKGKYSFKMPAAGVTVFINFEGKLIADPDETGVSAWLNTKGHNAYMRGVGAGLFSPDRGITRAEVAQVFYNLLLDQSVKQSGEFPDVEKEAWYHEAVTTLASKGIISGSLDGNFYPEHPITRAEFTSIAARFARKSITGELPLSDVSQDAWYYNAVLTAVNYGWINGYPDGSFRPEQPITRAESTVIFNRMLARSADRNAIGKGAGVRFLDVPAAHWAFYDTTEAVTTHDFTRTPQAEETWVTRK